MNSESTEPLRMALQTRSSIAADLQRLGVGSGQLLMMHSSLSSMGYVIGGAQSVVGALIEVLGPRGTLAMPSFSPEVSDPADWPDGSFTGRDLSIARGNIPTFNAAVTPTSMGAIAETFRTWPGVVRSAHPQVSVTARGPLAEKIVSRHELAWGQGAGSPFERLYQLDANLLLLGVGFNRATFLHYAESRVPHGRRKTRRIPIDQQGRRAWISVPDVGDDLNTYFPRIGEEFVNAGYTSNGLVGLAPSTLASSRTLVEFAGNFLSEALQQNPTA